MRHRIVIMATAALMMLVAGCRREPVAGLVTAKSHKPAHTTTAMMVMSNGKTTVMVPYYLHHPDRWVLAIERYDDDGRPTDVVDVYVTAEVYDAIEPGEWFEPDESKLDRTPARKVRKSD